MEFEVVRISNRYLIRRMTIDLIHIPNYWEYYELQDLWWTDEYIHHAKKFWFKKNAIKRAKELMEEPKTVWGSDWANRKSQNS